MHAVAFPVYILHSLCKCLNYCTVITHNVFHMGLLYPAMATFSSGFRLSGVLTFFIFFHQKNGKEAMNLRLGRWEDLTRWAYLGCPSVTSASPRRVTERRLSSGSRCCVQPEVNPESANLPRSREQIRLSGASRHADFPSKKSILKVKVQNRLFRSPT